MSVAVEIPRWVVMFALVVCWWEKNLESLLLRLPVLVLVDSQVICKKKVLVQSKKKKKKNSGV